MFTYLLKSAIWLTAFGLTYYFLLRNERFFMLNRLFLLTGLLASIFFPLITIHYSVAIPEIQGTVSAGMPVATGIIEENKNPYMMWKFILAGIILSGTIILFIKLIHQTIKIAQTIRQSETITINKMKVVKSNHFPFSFSFFTYVFVNPSLSEKEIREIVAHEKAHIGQHHWIDLVLVEMVRIIQWINPMAWLYSHFIRQNHEYLADKSALLSGSDPATYKAVLINQLLGDEVIRLGHSFSYSLNKKRFIMMKNSSTSINKRLKLLAVIPVIALVFYAFSEPRYQITQEKNESMSHSTIQSDTEGKEVKGKVIQQNGEPLHGTSIIIAGTQSGTMSDPKGQFLIDEVPENSELVFSFVGYKTVKTNPVFNNEMVIVMKRDTIEKNPVITIHSYDKTEKNPLVILDGEEIAFEDMNKIPPEVIQSIEVLSDEQATDKHGEKGEYGVIIISLKHHISESTKKEKKSTATPPDNTNNDNSQEHETPTTSDGKPVFFVVEDMPSFPGGDEKLADYVHDNLQYPEEARKNGIGGRVYVSFVISPEGKPTDIKIARGVDSLLDKEAMRVVAGMPDWNPGMQRGKKVAVQYVLPFNFVASEKKEEQVKYY